MGVDEIIEDITERLASDGTVDYIQLTEHVRIVERLAEVIFGVMSAVIIIGLPIIVAIELMYINFPAFRGKADEFTRKHTGRASRVVGLALGDARLALERANTIETGVTANRVYFNIKSKAIVIAVMMVTLALGAGSFVISILVNIVEAILRGLRGSI